MSKTHYEAWKAGQVLTTPEPLADYLREQGYAEAEFGLAPGGGVTCGYFGADGFLKLLPLPKWAQQEALSTL